MRREAVCRRAGSVAQTALIVALLCALVVQNLTRVARLYDHASPLSNALENTPARTADSELSKCAEHRFEQLGSAAKRANGSSDAVCWTSPSTGECVETYLLVFDLWERLVNFRSAFLNLVYVTHEMKIHLVEPFVFNSKVHGAHRFPHDFLKRKHRVQPMSAYFDLESLRERFPHVVPFERWAQRSAVMLRDEDWLLASKLSAVVKYHWLPRTPSKNGGTFGDPDARNTRMATTTALNSAVRREFQQGHEHSVDDGEVASDATQEEPESDGNSSFRNTSTPAHGAIAAEKRELYWWCGNSSSSAANNHFLAPNVVYERDLCVDGTAVMKRELRLGRTHLDAMLDHINQGRIDRSVPLSIALANFRKHAYPEYIRKLQRKYEQEAEPRLRLGRLPMRLAREMLQNEMGDAAGARVVAVHFRAGVAMARTQELDGGKFFQKWAHKCVGELLARAHTEYERLAAQSAGGTKPRFFLASDLFNDAMFGGERASSPLVFDVLDEMRRRLIAGLPGVFTTRLRQLELDGHGDLMGLASVVDMAACTLAEAFVSQRDSFAKLVSAERGFMNKTSVIGTFCAWSKKHAVT
mmetsp:Transcript_14671/g.39273  ORF Transcript_14671/g.39273 Transcript_14671/m.39273 type:complete len:583 (+) Transcript_14671:48-1796(+)